MKTQAKVALFLGFVNVCVVILFGAAIYYFLNKYSYSDFYKRLETRASIAAQYKFELDTLDASNLKSLRDQHMEVLENEKEFFIKINNVASASFLAAKYKLPERFIADVLRHGIAYGKKDHEFFVGIRYVREDAHYIVVVSAENYFASHHQTFLSNLLLGCLFFVLLIYVLVSVYFSRHIFDPIKRITGRVKQISTENIHLRLKEGRNTHEIGELVSTFNDLLNRIETSFETQKNFISNASHELGTPLTAIMGEADVALMKERTPDEYRQTIRNILHQADRLDQITKSLLFLAQTGYKGKAINFEVVRTDEVIWETTKLIDKLNPANQIMVDMSLLPDDHRKLKVKGNRQLLQLAMANILNNACKYSNNKPVTVYLASTDNHVVITVKDNGIGIPEEELAFIYDPFFRASNTQIFEGYGIGLPLTRNVVHLHRGEITVTSEVNKITTVQIKLPHL